MIWQHWVNFIVGVWLILSASFGVSLGSMTTNLAVSGIVVAVLSLWGALANQSEYSRMGGHRHA